MDYMNLGVRSRKTGLQVKENIEKDEFSMENVDDFFKEDESTISLRRRSRKSSLFQVGFFDNRELLPSLPSRPASETLKWSNADGSIDVIPQEPDEDEVLEDAKREYGEVQQSEWPQSPANVSLQTPPGSHLPSMAEEEEDGANEPYRTRSKFLSRRDDTYRDIPDLVEDDEYSRADTTLNTSDNALLREELGGDDYENESESDADYIEGMSLLQENSDMNARSDESMSDTTMSDDSAYKPLTLNRSKIFPASKTTSNYVSQSSSESESDRDFIRSQAQEFEADGPGEHSAGLRRSKRVKIAPLEYWRNEKVVYKRKSAKPVLDIDKVITYEDEEDEAEKDELTAKKRKSYNYNPSGRPRGRPRKSRNREVVTSNVKLDMKDLESLTGKKLENADWLEGGSLHSNVRNSRGEIGKVCLAFAPNKSKYQQVRRSETNNFLMSILFDDQKDVFASGFITLPPEGIKAPTGAADTTLVFCLIQGVIEFQIEETKFIGTPGTSCRIPAFNKYALKNMMSAEAKIFFVQIALPSGQSKLMGSEKSEAGNNDGTSEDHNYLTSDMSLVRS
ncbi:LAMI_0G03884g1_1 [Lachancea mirantina]|uniref:LAMI_0G03884g1_1 n=1 Tax=Lachancea mirantina TaxID=1230905 RepID=A0A1G4K8H3_9SACH|nr:LAMI_0G03884g1_1 [Lachancea mirantina]